MALALLCALPPLCLPLTHLLRLLRAHRVCVQLPSYEAVLQCFAAAKRDLAEVLSAVEFLDAESYELVHAHLDSRPPLETACRHYMLIELSGR